MDSRLNKISALFACLFLSVPLQVSAKTVSVSAAEYGNQWSFTVSSGDLECKDNAVVMHTSKGTYSINGKAMSRYKGKFPEWREIAKPYPGLESDPTAKMPPPHDLIKKGLDLCG